MRPSEPIPIAQNACGLAGRGLEHACERTIHNGFGLDHARLVSAEPIGEFVRRQRGGFAAQSRRKEISRALRADPGELGVSQRAFLITHLDPLIALNVFDQFAERIERGVIARLGHNNRLFVFL